MTLLEPNPPETSTAVVEDALRSLSEHRAFSSAELAAANLEEMRLAHGHEVYVLGLDELRDDPGIGDARAAGWRHLVSIGDRPVALAETSTRSPNEHLFAHINYGPFLAGTVAALAEAERMTVDERVEVRVLYIPALYLQALWLHPETGDEDTLLPIAPTPSGIEASRRYPASELLHELSARAREVPVIDEGDTRGA